MSGSWSKRSSHQPRLWLRARSRASRAGATGAVPGFMSQLTYRDTEVPYGVVVMMNAGCSVAPCDWEWLADHFGAIRDVLMEEAAGIAEGWLRTPR